MSRPRWLLPTTIILLAYAAAFALLPKGGHFINDNGAKLIQLEGIVRGGYTDYAVPWPGRADDPGLAWNPLPEPFGTVAGGRLFVTYSIPFAILSSFPYRAFGPAGLSLLPLLSGLLTLPAVWGLARLFPGGRLGPPLAVLIAGLGTPLWFYSLTFWEQAPAACLALWSILLATRRLAGGGRSGLAASGGLAGLAVHFRDDLYLLGAALALVVLIEGRNGAPGGRRGAAAFSSAFVLALLPLWALQGWALRHPLGLHLTSGAPWPASPGRFVADRFSVLRNLFLDSHGVAWLSLPIGLLYLVLWIRPLPGGAAGRARAVPAILAAATACGVVILAGHLAAERPIWYLRDANGLFAAAPALLPAFVRQDGGVARRVVSRVAGIMALAYVLLPQEFRSAGIHWGCRLLLPLYPLLAVPAASTLAAWWEERAGRRRAAAATALALCLGLSGALQIWSLRLLDRRAAFTTALSEAVARRPETAVVAVGWFLPQDLARVFYAKRIFLADDRREVGDILAALGRRGEERALLLQARPGPPPAAAAGAEVFADGLDFVSVEMRSVPARIDL